MLRWALAGIRRVLGVQVPPPRRSPWVIVGDLPPGSARRCDFCGRPGPQAGPLSLVRARHNPSLERAACAGCQTRNGMTPT